MDLQRYFLKLSYDGTNYHGWQIQKNAHSVQAEIENALGTLTQSKVEIVGAGRTDTGVHAKEIFAHMDITELPENFMGRLNTVLPKDIAIDSIQKVKADAHARFSAESRSYEYLISNKKDVFLQDYAHFMFRDLDVDKMNLAAKALLSEQDFTCFSKVHTQTKTNICSITHAEWIQQEHLLIFKITANRFLRNMVRAIVGSLLEIGLGKWEVEQINTIIASKDRSKAGFSVPAKGLYLTSVKYPKDVFI